MTKWEYYVVHVWQDNAGNISITVNGQLSERVHHNEAVRWTGGHALNELGQEGWELVTANTITGRDSFFLKRPL